MSQPKLLPPAGLDDERPFRVRLWPDGTLVEMSLPAFLRWRGGTAYEPHWSIATLLDPRGAALDEIIEIMEAEDPGNGLPEQALGLFNIGGPGWLPTWFPDTLPDSEEELTPAQRLVCFDKALAACARSVWPPQANLNDTKVAIARCLVRTLYLLEVEGTPTFV